MKKHLFLSHPLLLEHGDPSHIENASRLKFILDSLGESPYQKYLELACNRLATRDEIAAVHHLSYVDEVLSLDGKVASIDQETLLSPKSVQAALMAAGLGIELVEQILEGKVENGFALVRPPGHHATMARGMGFCLFNNIAIAAKKALARGIQRIVILDWDVHHGNGTQDVFYSDHQVLLIDFHQHNLFPANSGLLHEVGRDQGKGFTVNIPLPHSRQDKDYLYLFEKLVKPLVLDYRPELILVSAGFDAHESDPLGFMKLTTEGYGLLTAQVKALAKEVCQGKVAFFLEGGYNPFFLAKNVMECIEILVNDSLLEQRASDTPDNDIKMFLDQIYEFHIKQGRHIP